VFDIILLVYNRLSFLWSQFHCDIHTVISQTSSSSLSAFAHLTFLGYYCGYVSFRPSNSFSFSEDVTGSPQVTVPELPTPMDPFRTFSRKIPIFPNIEGVFQLLRQLPLPQTSLHVHQSISSGYFSCYLGKNSAYSKTFCHLLLHRDKIRKYSE
jgi:hypothetical protein